MWKGNENYSIAQINTKAKSHKNSEDSEELQNKQKIKIVENTEMENHNLNYQKKVRLERIIDQSNEIATNGRNYERTCGENERISYVG